MGKLSCTRCIARRGDLIVTAKRERNIWKKLANNYAERKSRDYFALLRVSQVLKCVERWHKCAYGGHASMNRERIAKLSRNIRRIDRCCYTNVAWATCQTNICKVEERRKNLAVENRWLTLCRTTQVCVHNRRGQIRGVHRNFSRVSTRVPYDKKKKKK